MPENGQSLKASLFVNFYKNFLPLKAQTYYNDKVQHMHLLNLYFHYIYIAMLSYK